MRCCLKIIKEQGYGSTSSKDYDDFTRLGLVSIVLLWATGIPLTVMVYGTLIWVGRFNKMFGATILLAVVAFLNTSHQQARVGSSPNLRVMRVVHS